MPFRLGRFLKSPAMTNSLKRGAGIGAGAGAFWGMASDDTSVVGGAFKGALAGAAFGGGFSAWRTLRSPTRRAARLAASSAKAGPVLASNTPVAGSKVASTLSNGTMFQDVYRNQTRRDISTMAGNLARSNPAAGAWMAEKRRLGWQAAANRALATNPVARASSQERILRGR